MARLQGAGTQILQITCVTSTKVQILTQKLVEQVDVAFNPECHYKSTNAAVQKY
jgi:hypothetical protein